MGIYHIDLEKRVWNLRSHNITKDITVKTLGRPRGIGWRGRWEGGSGWGIHVNPWLIQVNV